MVRDRRESGSAGPHRGYQHGPYLDIRAQSPLAFPRLPLSQGTRAARHVHDKHAHRSYFHLTRNLGEKNVSQEMPDFNPKTLIGHYYFARIRNLHLALPKTAVSAVTSRSVNFSKPVRVVIELEPRFPSFLRERYPSPRGACS